MRASTKQKLQFTWALFCSAVFVSQAPAAGRVLSDEEKKATVYKMYQDYKSDDFPDVKDISPLEAMSLMRTEGIIFVDTRKADEMKVSMLPGAITRESFLEDIDRYRGRMIVAYCTISFRSGIFTREMTERGMAIFNLRGGILAWVLESGEVFDDGGVTRKIHVYGDRWNYAPNGYEAVKFGLFDMLF